MKIDKEYEQAYSLYENNELDQALKIVSIIIVGNEDDYEILNLLGLIHFKLGNYEEAEIALEKAIKIWPDEPEFYIELIELKIKKKLFKEANTLLEVAWENVLPGEEAQDLLEELEEKIEAEQKK